MTAADLEKNILRDEIERLTKALHYEQHWLSRIGTHGPGCWSWGPAHYECAVKEIKDAEKKQPVAWHYTNNGGGSAMHWGPSAKLDADIQTAKDYPRAHRVTPLYAAPPPALAPCRYPDCVDNGPDGKCALDELRAALAEPEQKTKVEAETEYNIGFKAGWEKGWHYGSMVENSACARIVERNAEICVHSLTLWDVLNANALAIRARSNINE